VVPLALLTTAAFSTSSIVNSMAESAPTPSVARYSQYIKSVNPEITDKDLAELKLPELHRRAFKGPNFLAWNIDADAILDLKDEIIKYSTSVEDAVAKIPAGSHTFENTFGALARLEDDISPIVSTCDFLHHVHPDSVIRDASFVADKDLSAFFVSSGLREDVYASVMACIDEMKQRGEYDKLTGEDKRFVEFTVRDYQRNGLHLDEKSRARMKELQKEMSELSIQFSRNLGEDNSKLEFTKEELQGMPDDFLANLEKKDDKYVVTMKYPDGYPLLKLCQVPKTRQAVENCFSRMCKDQNSVILEKLVQLRHEKSQLLGFENHASFVLDVRMAKSPKTVLSFLNDLKEKLAPLYDQEREIFLKLKAEDKFSEQDGKLNIYDFRYFMNMRETKEFEVDHEVVKQYFPLQTVTQGLLDIYQELLGLKFVEVEKPLTWQSEVRLFDVFDAVGNGFVGQFYLDLHPRQGKYGHAAVFGLQPSFGFGDDVKADEKQYPVAAMVANFTKPTPEKPSLLGHNEVVTYFHEFGHVVHQICSKTKYSRFSGTRVERDFVEAPSQMLENWCWEKESLLRMSGHYQSKEAIPDKLLQKLVESKNANAGAFNIRQLFFGLFDQTIHSRSQVSTAEIYNGLLKELLKMEASPDSNGSASFGHMAGGYDATYYGYLWSEVYSADMFASKFKGNLMNPAVGMEYRNKILKVGGSRDAMESLVDFLGRESTADAFIKAKGLS
jgi:thimet oligopeptidase